MHNFIGRIAVLVLTLGLYSGASASIVLVTDRAALNTGDSVDWAQLGPDGTVAPSTTTVSSTGLLEITVTTGDPSGLLRLDQGNGWNGNFMPGDSLLTNNSTNYAPLTLTFASPVSGIGANIQRDNFGAFTATISVYSGNVLLATFTEDGDSNTDDDGSAIFIGVSDTIAEITKVVFGLTAGSQGPNADFAINSLSIAVVPEPMTLGSAATAALFACFIAWRRRRIV